MAGYTRQDTANNISNGNVIDADDFDAEYNAVEAAFNASTGHSHDGTAGEGAPIEKVGPAQDLIVSSTQVIPKTTNTLDLGSASVQFKSAWFDGTVDTDALAVSANATVGGTLGVTGVVTATGGVTGNVTGNVTGDLIGDVTGTVSDVSNHDTDDIAEGATNLYYTDARSRGAVSATGSLSYNSSTGVFSFTQGNTDTVAEGSTNLYYTTARATTDAKAAISVTDSGGDGSLTYSAGNITYTGPSAAETRAHFSGGTGVSITNGVVAIGQPVGTSDSVTFNNAIIDGNLTVNGTTTTVNSNDVNIGDATLTLNADETGTPSQDAGITIERGTAANKSLHWDESEDKWSVFGETIVAGTFEGSLTGNADTATALATARTIAGQSFDGSANISIAPTDLTGVTATATELNYVDGVISSVQTQLDRRLELISETVLTSSASDVIFTLPTGYRNFQLVLNNVKSSSNTTTLYLEFSTDGGSTWITSNYDSLIRRHLSGSSSTITYTTGVAVAANNEADSSFNGTPLPVSGACGIINLFNPLNSNEYTTATSYVMNTAYQTPAINAGTSVYHIQSAVNAINLSHKTGAGIAAGAVIALYGMKDY